MKNISKKNNGITLIALVITIIVLLILAGISISMLSGDNSIIAQAGKAERETEEKTVVEKIKLAVMDALMEGNDKTIIEDEETLMNALKSQGIEDATIDPIGGGYKVVVNGLTQIVSDKGITRTENDIEKLHASEDEVKEKKLKLTDVNGHIITIPKNFNIASESPTEVKKGIIIEDSEDNQYVWIPVFTKEQYSWGADFSDVKETTKDSDEYFSAIEQALINTTNGYTKTYRYASSYRDEWYSSNKNYYIDSNGQKKYYTNGNMTETKYNELYDNMLRSIYEDGGFYIARYEMGIEQVNTKERASEIHRTSMNEYLAGSNGDTSEEPSIEGMNTPISRVNSVVYVYITQAQAQMLAKKLEEKEDYSNVNSSIMFGVQWDAVCVFIEKFDENNTAKTKSQWLTNKDFCNLWGNYYYSKFIMDRGFFYAYPSWKQDYTNEKTSGHTVCTAGACDQNSSLNIYDFAGNCDEFTLEYRYGYNPSPCVLRGDETAYDRNAQGRYVGEIYTSSNDRSSRVTLFCNE